PVEYVLDGVQQCIADPPVAFAVPGGTIEVATSMYGLSRMHVVPEDGGPARPLRPHERALEGLRARFGRRHPGARRVTGLLASLSVLVALVLMEPQAAERLTSIGAVAERVGSSAPPIRPPAWLNTSLLVAGSLAATERALTLRNHWLIDTDTTWTSFT